MRRIGGVVVAVLVTVLVAVMVALVGASTASGASSTAAWPRVGEGANGVEVTTAQFLLRQHGHDIPADGGFGPVTAAAVAEFQAARGLVADGWVGPQTWPHLIVEVREGSTGDAVKAAQTQLNEHGAGIPVDGRFGPVTADATRAFQSANGLAADGVVGPQTWQTLVGGGGGGDNPGPAGHALPLDRDAAPREAYGAPHWNGNPAIDLIVDHVPVYAVTSGVVDHYDSESCGVGIRLLQPDGARFVYCHLSERLVGNGVQVDGGARMATSGDTGNSGAPHLHIEIRTSDGVARCPQNYLLAIYDGQQPPNLPDLPTSGCTS